MVIMGHDVGHPEPERCAQGVPAAPTPALSPPGMGRGAPSPVSPGAELLSLRAAQIPRSPVGQARRGKPLLGTHLLQTTV